MKPQDEDAQFFTDHRDRYAHIRLPRLTLMIDKQRHTAYVPECEREFLSLGDHQRSRRRMLLWRVPEGHPAYDPDGIRILKIPFLLFADETVEDRDDILLPLIDEIMHEQAKKQGVAV